MLTPDDVGQVVREKRREQKLTQPELAGVAGVGVRFIVDLEKGKPTCQIGKALRVMHFLGIRVTLQG